MTLSRQLVWTQWIVASLGLFVLGAVAARAGSIEVVGSLPRQLSEGSFQMVVTIKNVSEEDHTRGNKDLTAELLEQLKNRFNVKIPKADTSTEVPVKQEDASGGMLFYLSEYQAHGDPVQDGTTWTYTYYLQVTETQAGYLAKTVGDEGKLGITIQFYLGDTSKVVAERNDIVLVQEVYVVTSTPEFQTPIAIAGTMKALSVKWEPVQDVEVSGGAETTKPSSRINVYVVDPDVLAQGSLPARTFDPTKKEDAKTTCTFALPGEDGGNCVTCAANVYLDADDIRAGNGPSGLSVQTEAVSDGGATVSGLANEHRYFVFLQYEPDGLGVSQCMPGMPSPNHTITELNGEGEAQIVDLRCFIATAAFGSPLDHHLTVFRQFRDDVLLHIPGGADLVTAYYELSPPLARFIDRHPIVKTTVREGLTRVAAALEAILPAPHHPDTISSLH